MLRTRAEIAALLDRLEDCVAGELEGQDIDFKEWGRGCPREQLQGVVSAAVCMANGGGGTVVFGVADGVTGRRHAVVGVPQHVSASPLGSVCTTAPIPGSRPCSRKSRFRRAPAG